MNDNQERFLRQAGLIPTDRMRAVRATVIGVGAIGRQVALQLAAVGVRRIQLVDFVTVEWTNVTTQGYWHCDAEEMRPKVEATRDAILTIDPTVVVDVIGDRYRPRTTLHEAVFCCVDSIGARTPFWRSAQHRAQSWVDGRMLSEVLRVLAVSEELSRRGYEQTLFPREEAQHGSCTSRSTIYAGAIAAALMVQQYSRWLRGLPLDFDTTATAYERNSLIVTTNLPFENWTEVLGSERLTGAALDRLTHRCHIRADGEDAPVVRAGADAAR